MILHTQLKLLTAAAVLSLGAASASAQSYWTNGHGDIGIELHGDHFHTHWGLDTGATVNGSQISQAEEYSPNTLIAHLLVTQSAPSGSSAYLGVADGSTVWRAGNNTYQPNLGFSAYGVGLETDWTGGGLTISLSGWNSNNPGEFALLQGTNILASTFDPGTSQSYDPDVPGSANSFFIYAGDHDHYSWFFTEAGYYELSFTWSGTHVTEGFVTTTNTYGFQVGAIPEPSTWALIIAGTTGLGAVAWRKRSGKARAA